MYSYSDGEAFYTNSKKMGYVLRDVDGTACLN